MSLANMVYPFRLGNLGINYTNLLQYTFVLQVVTMLVYSPSSDPSSHSPFTLLLL